MSATAVILTIIFGIIGYSVIAGLVTAFYQHVVGLDADDGFFALLVGIVWPVTIPLTLPVVFGIAAYRTLERVVK